MRRTPVVVALAACALVAWGCGDDDEGEADASAGETTLVVSAAASMTEALESCADTFGEEEDARVRLSFAGSDELAAQIRQGAEVDVFVAANTSLPQQLRAEGLLAKTAEFATNELVIAVPSGSEIDSLDDLAEDGVTVVMGSESVPVGAYTREALAGLPPAREKAILANVRSNEPDVNGIVGKLVQGAADAGFVYATDVTATDGALGTVALPPELEPEVAYGAGVVSEAREPELARKFLRGLLRGACADALREAGFGPP